MSIAPCSSELEFADCPQIYSDLPVFWDEINSMDPAADYEGKVCGVWNVLLHHYFPASEGYVRRAQDKVVRGFLDFNTIRWTRKGDSGAKEEAFFLVTQCKRELREPGKEAWEEGKAQLDRYLGWLEEANKTSVQRFGVVAVGKLCQFYVYRPKITAGNGVEQEAEVEDYAAGSAKKMLNLTDPENAQVIHRRVRHIKDMNC